MKSQIIAASITLVCLTQSTVADTFILKDGSRFEGSIIRQDATSYVLEIQVSKSIKDEKTIAKADVAKIEKLDPEIVAFDEISKLVPAPDLLTREEYDRRIHLAEKYLANFRGSVKTKDTKAIIATLKSEQEEVIAGGIKLKGKIVPHAEYKSNAYEIDARIMEMRIRNLIDKSQYLPALRAFGEFDRDFRNTVSYAALLPLIQRVITAYLAEASDLLASYDSRVKERQIGIDRMPNADRRRTEAAIQEEAADAERHLKAEKDSKIGWVTTSPFCKESLADTLTFGKAEQGRLGSNKGASPIDGGKAYRDAYNLIQSKSDTKSITAAIINAKTALVAPRYIAKLEAASQSTGSGR